VVNRNIPPVHAVLGIIEDARTLPAQGDLGDAWYEEAKGRLWIWDWKSCKVHRKLQCHDKVLIQALWHPIEPSTVATCSWDGTIKFWD
jgi:WD40 repeat protein